MYTKQLKIVKNKVVETILLTSANNPNGSGVNQLYKYSGLEAKSAVSGVQSKLPPYNYSDPETLDIRVKTKAVGEMFKSIIGASDKQMIANMEQNCGILKADYLNSDLPCIVGVYAFKNASTDEVMVCGEIISTFAGRKYLYSILRKLGMMQNGSDGNKMYIGVIKNRAVTKPRDNNLHTNYEMLCDFIVSLDALKILEEKKFGFYIDNTALEKFNYKLAGIEATRPSKSELEELKKFVEAHNKLTTDVLVRFNNSK